MAVLERPVQCALKLSYKKSNGDSDGTYTLTKLKLDAGNSGVYALAEAIKSLQAKTAGSVVKSVLTALEEDE
jgi:hypothetical protein